MNVSSKEMEKGLEIGVPAMSKFALGLFLNQTEADQLSTRNVLTLRGWLGDALVALARVFLPGAYVFCAATASGTLALFLHFASEFRPLRVYYNAWKPDGFKSDSTIGTTFNRDIYTPWPFAGSGDHPVFVETTKKIILHEATHSVQYYSIGYSLALYGWNYIYHGCKCVGYKCIPYEAEAYRKQNELDNLLQPTGSGRLFFDVWRRIGLKPLLGFPTYKSNTPFTVRMRSALSFQHGILELDLGNLATACFRTFTNAEIQARSNANCFIEPDCKSKKLKGREPPPQPGDGGGPRNKSTPIMPPVGLLIIAGGRLRQEGDLVALLAQASLLHRSDQNPTFAPSVFSYLQ
ncbi:hypothetical protein CC80DRAFT_596974 [Byssothecium circinans]|uniref:Uncharacterized protein n=1 Tax=Byssothecium circinans TaxID=147558 RepID=A0A6A5THK0_9PLEO|nr:hypothetical protein CC80DRAFT_596974 [Byssothecium circinans]